MRAAVDILFAAVIFVAVVAFTFTIAMLLVGKRGDPPDDDPFS